MESLALLVAGLVLAMLVSSCAALIITWRARTMRGRVVAVMVGVPGLLLGSLFVTSVGSSGGMLFGAFGLSGFIAASYRWWRATRPLAQD